MSSNTNLEIAGSLRRHSPAELFAEISAAKLNGSLRLANGETAQKSVFYFDAGDACFAVSNARRFRLFELLVEENKITKEQLAAIPDFTNDLALRENLIKADLLSKTAADALLTKQIEMILKDAFGWRDARQGKGGEWTFSPLVRVKGDIRFQIDAARLLLEHARNLPDDAIAAKFKEGSESFAARASMPVHINLLPEEAFVFSRFEASKLSAQQAAMFGGLPAPKVLRIVYTLWLAGFLARENWDAPFSVRSLAAISAANLTLKKPAVVEAVAGTKSEASARVAAAAGNNPPVQKVEIIAPPPEELPLEKYLERIEAAQNYYDFFAVAPDAPVADIKRGYLFLAKRFHPDLFRRQIDAEKFKQIQDAFTRIAQAYETLKHEKTREVYDYKMRKQLTDIKSGQAANDSADAQERSRQMRVAQAAEDFESGFNLMMDGELGDALPFFARAAHLAEDNARYHAYYGKALAADGTQKHKAEAELQAAVRLAPENPDLRLMLAEFFVEMNLPKRAEGELKRLLSIFPDNAEAKQMLDSLAKR